ncbi:protein phosphatase 2C domain-containing protein [Streptomyces ziwulingensis]|uniref:PPM-type phosphatase domain-containing protein n=1 Tax=Streptomyces ziwulingensis TaxID=1045501 RepID=A0ABP9CS67_9ACTN
MSQQGGSPTGHEDDDWWGQLYDDSTGDTGAAAAADSLDDRFASAADTVDGGEDTGASGVPTGVPTSTPTEALPAARAEAAPDPGPPAHAPWQPPPATPTGPTTFPAAFPAALPAAAPPAPSARPPVTSPAPPAVLPTTPPPPTSAPPPPTAPPPPASPPPPLPASWRPAAGRAAPVEAGTAASRETGAVASGEAEPVAAREYVGSGPPTYHAEPTALPPADPADLGGLVADTVLDGARYGACTLRALSSRGDSARFRGDPRRDALLTARFGTGDQALVLVATATGTRAAEGAHRAAAEVCRWIGRAVGRSHVRLAEDLRAGRRGDLKSGLHRLTDRSLGRLRASAVEQGLAPDAYAATLRCLLLPADPHCRTRVFFGVGTGGLWRLRDGDWQDIEPRPADTVGEPVVGFGSQPAETPEGDRLTMDLGIPTPPSPYQDPVAEPPREPFRFRASVARPGDVLLLCGAGLAEPLRGEPALRAHLAARWSGPTAPGLADFLADGLTRVKGYADDRTAAAVWEA